MNTLQPIRIYLGEKRASTTTDNASVLFTHRSVEDAAPVADGLTLFCEVTQKPATAIEQPFSPARAIFVLPLVGKVIVDGPGGRSEVEAGQLMWATTSDAGHLNFENPYSSEWISYILWEATIDYVTDSRTVINFDIDTCNGMFMKVLTHDPSSSPLSVHLGLFHGRQERCHRMKWPANQFIFVLSGAFEVHDRLLQAKDALMIPATDALELEALSNNAMMLVLSLDEGPFCGEPHN